MSGRVHPRSNMEAKVGGWGRRPMPKIVEVRSRSSGVNQRSNLYSLSYGSETWWVGSSSNADNVGGLFKVIRGQPNVESV